MILHHHSLVTLLLILPHIFAPPADDSMNCNLHFSRNSELFHVQLHSEASPSSKTDSPESPSTFLSSTLNTASDHPDDPIVYVLPNDMDYI